MLLTIRGTCAVISSQENDIQVSIAYLKGYKRFKCKNNL